MKLILSILLIFSIYIAQAQSQLAMSFTGNYNIGNQDLETSFNNGLGLNAEIYYYFDDSPFAVSFSIGTNSFLANDEYTKAYTDAQHNIIDGFTYKITQYSIPILLSGNYRFFRDKKFQVSVGLSLGLYSLTQKFKQTSSHFSDVRIDTKNEFGVYPHLGLMYGITDNIGIILKGGYNQTFGSESISYMDVRFGLIYKI